MEHHDPHNNPLIEDQTKPSLQDSQEVDLSAWLKHQDTHNRDIRNSHDSALNAILDQASLEALIELKISRFLDQIGRYYPEDLYALLMGKAERPLLRQILKRTGGNQLHAAKILGINRNTLRRKIKSHGINLS